MRVRRVDRWKDRPEENHDNLGGMVTSTGSTLNIPLQETPSQLFHCGRLVLSASSEKDKYGARQVKLVCAARKNKHERRERKQIAWGKNCVRLSQMRWHAVKKNRNATPITKSAPWRPNMLMRMCPVRACYAKCIFAAPVQTSHACSVFEIATKTLRFVHFKKSAESIAPATQKDGRKSKSRRSNVVRFCNFEFEICFAPQLRSFFWTAQLPKGSGPELFKIFTLTSIYVSRHSRIHLSNSTSKSAPRLLLAWGCALRQRRVHFLRRSTSKWAPELRCF